MIEKQLSVTIWIGSAIFETSFWLAVFILGATIGFAVNPNQEPWITVLIWCPGILRGLICLLLKFQTKNLNSGLRNPTNEKGRI